MNVILDGLREVIIDDNLEIVHVETTRRHVGGHHDGIASLFEVTQGPIALRLALVAMDCANWVPIPFHLPLNIVSTTLGRGENKHLGASLQLVDVLDQRFVLVVIFNALDDLFDVLVGMKVEGPDIDLSARGGEGELRCPVGEGPAGRKRAENNGKESVRFLPSWIRAKD